MRIILFAIAGLVIGALFGMGTSWVLSAMLDTSTTIQQEPDGLGAPTTPIFLTGAFVPALAAGGAIAGAFIGWRQHRRGRRVK